MNIIKVIKGDLVKLANEGQFNVIVHGCNCFNTMGAGVALQIANTFPEARRVDAVTNYGDRRKLGSYSIASVRGCFDDSLIIVNGYTQYGTASTPDDCVVDYDAIRKVFGTVIYNLACLSTDIRIGIPMIGAGLAGGDWNIISAIIEEELHGFDHNPDLLTLVEYDG